jgi:hypothetical protein
MIKNVYKQHLEISNIDEMTEFNQSSLKTFFEDKLYKNNNIKRFVKTNQTKRISSYIKIKFSY